MEKRKPKIDFYLPLYPHPPKNLSRLIADLNVKTYTLKLSEKSRWLHDLGMSKDFVNGT